MGKLMKIRKFLHRVIGILRSFVGPRMFAVQHIIRALLPVVAKKTTNLVPRFLSLLSRGRKREHPGNEVEKQEAIVSTVTAAVFLRSYYKYRYCPEYYYLYAMLGDSLCWSRGSASVLCVSCCLILLPMCRNVLAHVRNSNKVIGRIFGRLLDKNIWFHKACAVVIIISTGVHIGAHFVNARRFSDNYSLNFTDLNFASYHYQEPLELFFTSVAGLTGILMTLLLLAMIVTSMTAVRRASYEMFWYTHHLFIVFFLLLFVHGFGGVVKHQVNLCTHSPGCEINKNKTSHVTSCSEDPVFRADEPEAWKWCIVPLLIYIMDRIIRAVRSFQKVEIIQVVQHYGEAVEVKMRKNNFTAAPGQYVFIKCADVSRFEWHPFTLTQCPSSDDSTFSIHCKIIGDWTETFADRLCQPSPEAKEEQKALMSLIQNGKCSSYVRPSIKIAVDGPYGSPCMDIWRYDVSVCIATGIGVTPFAAIINKLRQNVKSERRLNLRRLYFVWVCKHVHSFEWFVELLHSTHTELWERNRPDFLICNFYVTGTQSEKQVDTKQYNSWLTSRLHQNRPSWKAVFDRVSRENPRTEVGIFYCGSRKVTSVLKKTCQRFYPTRTRFIFNKEILT